MAIDVRETNVHWNYFLALEADVKTLSRFVEFKKPNFLTYSIEMARVLMTASSEVDVLAKIICERLDPAAHRRNIREYGNVILALEPRITGLRVLVPRFGLTLRPWSSWTLTASPEWWS